METPKSEGPDIENAPAERLDSAPGGLTIRASLMLGFTVMFSLWAGSIYYLTLRLAEIEASSAAAHAHHMRGQELLLTVRGHVLLASLHVRDALDERNPQDILPYSQDLHRLRQYVEQALERY